MNKKQWKTFSIVLCFLLLITTFLSKPIFAAGFDNCNVNVIDDYTFIPKNLIVQYEKSTKGIVVDSYPESKERINGSEMMDFPDVSYFYIGEGYEAPVVSLLSSDSFIKVRYDAIGTYNNKELGVYVTFSNPQNCKKLVLYSDFWYGGYILSYTSGQATGDYKMEFFYTEDPNTIITLGNNTFLTAASLASWKPSPDTLSYEGISFENSGTTDVYYKKDGLIVQEYFNNQYWFYCKEDHSTSGKYVDEKNDPTFMNTGVMFHQYDSSWECKIICDREFPPSGAEWFYFSASILNFHEPENPSKEIDGKLKIDKEIGDIVQYTISQPINTLVIDGYGKYNKLEFVDTLPQEVDYISADIKSNNNENLSSAGTLTYNTLTHTVKYIFSNEYLKQLKYEGQIYTLTINCKINEKALLKKQIDNQGYTLINDIKILTNVVNIIPNNEKTITITKIWNDENNKYNTRPESLNITILRNGLAYRTISLSNQNKLTGYNNVWQLSNIPVPKYDDNKNEYIYTIKEDENNINLLSFYKTPTYNQDVLTVINTGSWMPININEYPEYTIKFQKNIINKNNEIATAKDFEKIKLNINDTYNFPIILKQLEKTFSKGETSMKENYGNYTGKEFKGIVTNKSELIFTKIEPGKYEIQENNVLYFDFFDFSLISGTSGTSLTKENGKYYITISSLTNNTEEIIVKVTNKIKNDRNYDKFESESNLFFKTQEKELKTDPPVPEISPDDLPAGDVFVDKTVTTNTLIVNEHEFNSDQFLIQLTALSKQISENKEPVDIIIMVDTTMSTSNPIEGYTYDARNRNGSIDDFIIALNEFIDLAMCSHNQNRVGIICYGGQNMWLPEDPSLRQGSAPLEILLELGHYENPNWTQSSPYIYIKGEGSIEDNTYKGGGIIQGKYINFNESSENNSMLDYIPNTTIRNIYWKLDNLKGYSFKISSNINLLKDNVPYTVHKNYGGWNGTYTQNAILKGYEYLTSTIKGDTAMLIVMTDGEANMCHSNYTQSMSPTDPLYDTSFLTPYSDVGTLTVASATYIREKLKQQYDDVFFYTLCAYVHTDYSVAVLNPESLQKTLTDESLIIMKNNLNKLFSGQTISLTTGEKLTKKTNTSNYFYNDDFYYSNEIQVLIDSLKYTFYLVKGNSTGDIVFYDTLGKDMEIKDIKGLIIDGILYANFINNNNIYTCPELPEITIKITEEDDKQLIEYKIPEKYTTSLSNLIFEVGLRENFVFEKNTIYTFKTNETCIVKFTITPINEIDFNRTVLKTENITKTENFISNSKKENNEIIVILGNNGTMKIRK